MITLILIPLFIAFIVVTALAENTQPFWASVLIIALGVGYWFLDKNFWLHTFNYVKTNPFSTILIVLGYIFLGVLFTFYKWFKYLKSDKETQDSFYEYENKSEQNRLDKEYERWVKKQDQVDFTQRKVGVEYKGLITHVPEPIKYRIPKASDMKEEIITWMTFWIFSFTYMVFRHPLEWTFDLVSGYYDKIGLKIYK